MSACPFCGSSDRAVTPNLTRCLSCGATGPDCRAGENIEDAWNRRAPLLAAQPCGLVEAVKKVLSYSRDIRDGKINYRPQDHIDVLERALAAHPNCGACPGDGSVCDGACKVESENPPAVLHPDLIADVELHPATKGLVLEFARALALKLSAAEKKYGYSDHWLRDDWREECQYQLAEHVAKGDPRDVAAYCAFAWFREWPTLAAQPVAQTPVEMSPAFTDTARGAIAWVLYHHQGASSAIGQPLRFALGIGAHEPLRDWHIAEAKRWADLSGAKTADFHPVAQPPNARQVAQAGVPENWRQFVEECALTRGGEVSGNHLAARAQALLAASPAPMKQAGVPDRYADLPFHPYVRARTLLTLIWRSHDAGGISMGRSFENVLLEAAMDLLEDFRDRDDVSQLDQQPRPDIIGETRDYLSTVRAVREGLAAAAPTPEGA